jgi:hypothetical protein
MAVNDYCTLPEMKAALPNLTAELSDGSKDALLTRLITGSSRAIDRFTEREPGAFFVTTDDTRYFNGPPSTGSDLDKLWVDPIADVPTTVNVSADGSPTGYVLWAATDYTPWPYSAKSYGKPYMRLDLNIKYGAHQFWPDVMRAVKVVGPFGYSKTVPDDVKQVIIMQVGRWYKRAQQAYQDKVEIMTGGNSFVYVERLDRDIEKTIAHLKNSRLASPMW